MQPTRQLAKFDSPYPVIAVGATWFVLLVFILALTTRASTLFADLNSWRGVLAVVDIHLSALITATSLLLFSGLWTFKSATRFGRNVVRSIIALLVIANWAAWCVALWLH